MAKDLSALSISELFGQAEAMFAWISSDLIDTQIDVLQQIGNNGEHLPALCAALQNHLSFIGEGLQKLAGAEARRG